MLLNESNLGLSTGGSGKVTIKGDLEVEGTCNCCSGDGQTQRTAKVGDIVGYVLDEGPKAGLTRPAIVVHNWYADAAVDPESGEAATLDPGTLQLQVFADGDGKPWNDGLPNVFWETSVVYDEDEEPGTWHWL